MDISNETKNSESGLKYELLARFRLNYCLLFAFPLALLLSAFLIEMLRLEGILMLLATIPPLAVFTILFGIIHRNGLRFHKIWLLAGGIFSLVTGYFIILSVFLRYGYWYDSYRHREDAITFISMLFGFGMLVCLIFLFVHGIRYLLQKDRIPGSGKAVLFTMIFITITPLAYLLFAFAMDNWQFRENMIEENWVNGVAIATTFAIALCIPMASLYLRSFLKLTTWKRIVFTMVSYCVIFLAVAGIFLWPAHSGGFDRALGAPKMVEQRWAAMEDRVMAQEAMPGMIAKNEMAKEKTMDRKQRGIPDNATAGSSSGEGEQAEPAKKVRVRENFPETLYWNPELLVKAGKARIDIPVSDSITTFRMTCQGVTGDGTLGSMTKGIRVFQDFFVDIDFPATLTQNDEISVPVQVYNYLPGEQTVRFKVEKEKWFELLDDPEKKASMVPNQVGVVYFRIKVKGVGPQTLTVFAYGDKMSDAVKRPVMVEPDGKKIESVINGNLSQNMEYAIYIDPASIPDASKIIAKCYPGMESVLVEGLEGMLRLPGG